MSGDGGGYDTVLPWDIRYPAAEAARLPGLEEPRGGGRPTEGSPVQAGELWPETCVPAAESIARRRKRTVANALIPRGR